MFYMKHNGSKKRNGKQPTLAELVAAVSQLTDNEQLSAYIVADLINSRRVRLEGKYRGKRVIVS